MLTAIQNDVRKPHYCASGVIAVAKGKQNWDKRETERRREDDRDARSAIVASKRRNA